MLYYYVKWGVVLKNTDEMPFGYKENGEIDLLQSDVVRTIFDVMIQYCDKITDEQLEDFAEEHKEQYGEELDFTQVKETLAIGMVKRFINEELDRTWQEYLFAKKGQRFLVPANNLESEKINNFLSLT